MAKFFLLLGALAGLFGVVLGAFGAHALKARLAADMLQAWRTAVEYQFYHALALIAVGLLLQRMPSAGATAAGAAFAAGILLFSGSLYAIALGGPRWLGPVTPLGGLAFIAGWLCLLVSLLRQP